MEIPLPCSVGMPGIEEGGNDPEDVRWNSQEQGVDIAVAESPNDCGKKVGHSSGRNETEKDHHLDADQSLVKQNSGHSEPGRRGETYENPHLDILEGQLHAMPKGLILRACPIILPNVLI